MTASFSTVGVDLFLRHLPVCKPIYQPAYLSDCVGSQGLEFLPLYALLTRLGENLVPRIVIL